MIRTVTLSKSLAGQGGAALGAPEVIGTLVDTGRGFIFDTGLAPPCAGAALAALDVIAGEPGLGARARASAARLAGIAADPGLRVTAPDAAVLAVVIGESARAVAARGSAPGTACGPAASACPRSPRARPACGLPGGPALPMATSRPQRARWPRCASIES